MTELNDFSYRKKEECKEFEFLGSKENFFFFLLEDIISL